MKVQINTDDNVQGHEALAERVEAEVESVLSRFREDITRVEVHISDENAVKPDWPPARGCDPSGRDNRRSSNRRCEETSECSREQLGAAKRPQGRRFNPESRRTVRHRPGPSGQG